MKMQICLINSSTIMVAVGRILKKTPMPRDVNPLVMFIWVAKVEMSHGLNQLHEPFKGREFSLAGSRSCWKDLKHEKDSAHHCWFKEKGCVER